jgi:hypothetical protein
MADRRRTLTLPTGFIHPCLPMVAPRPPSGQDWLHEIKLDGFRIIARKSLSRVNPSCTIDGEAVASVALAMCSRNYQYNHTV